MNPLPLFDAAESEARKQGAHIRKRPMQHHELEKGDDDDDGGQVPQAAEHGAEQG